MLLLEASKRLSESTDKPWVKFLSDEDLMKLENENRTKSTKNG